MADDHAVPSFWNCVVIYRTFIDGEINEVGWCSGSHWTLYSENLTSDNFGVDLVIFVDWELVCLEFLILWLAVFVLSIKV